MRYVSLRFDARLNSLPEETVFEIVAEKILFGVKFGKEKVKTFLLDDFAESGKR